MLIYFKDKIINLNNVTCKRNHIAEYPPEGKPDFYMVFNFVDGKDIWLKYSSHALLIKAADKLFTSLLNDLDKCFLDEDHLI